MQTAPPPPPSRPANPAVESRRRPVVVCVLLFFATALCFLDRQVLSILAPQIMAEFGMTNTVYSRVVFAFVLSYTVMLALGGRMMDVLGTKRGLGLAVGFWSLASAAHAFVMGPISLAVARFFLGVGEGPCFPCTTKAAMEVATPERRGLAVGFSNSGSAIGAVVAPPLTAWAAIEYGWRGTFAATAVLGFVWLIAWRTLAPAPAAATVRRDTGSIGAGFRRLLARPEVRRLVMARFCFDWVFYFYMFWIPQYLSSTRGLSVQEIGALVWIPFVALEISNVSSGHVSDALIRRGWERRRARLTLMLAAALLTPASWLASQATTVGTAVALMAVLLFAHGIWISNYMTHIGETVESHEVATTVGLTGTFGGIAGMISNLIIGPVVDRYSFVPVFLATAVVYPIAWIILRGRTPLAQKG